MTAAAHAVRIVADDLTGAADAAATFASRGADATVCLRWPPRADAEVVARVADIRWNGPTKARSSGKTPRAATADPSGLDFGNWLTSVLSATA